MYCQKCGNSIPDDSKVCKKCGAVIMTNHVVQPAKNVKKRSIRNNRRNYQG